VGVPRVRSAILSAGSVRAASVRVAAAAVAAAALAGCGGSGSGSGETVTGEALSPAAAMARVASSVESVESSAYTFELAAAAGISMKGHGAFRTKPDLAMSMVFDKMSMGPISMGTGMEQRVIGDTLYVRGGMFGMGGDKWMKISFAEAGEASGTDVKSMMSQVTQADPRRQLQALLAAGDVREVGEEKVDGVSTTHYTGEVSASGVASSPQLDATVRDELQKAYAAAGMGDMHVDVWVDDEHRARKFVSTSPTKLGDVRMTMTFSDYGKAVEISAPPADEVSDLSGLAKMGGPTRPPTAS
jgi:hypothetical protein